LRFIRPRRIGVLGGTFDPPHYGHLAAAEEAREALGLSAVLFVPSGHPPHKEPQGLLPATIRHEMTVLATAGNPGFLVSEVELGRDGPTYTIDTLRLLEQQYPGDALYFIVGADMLLDLPAWKEAEQLLATYHFVAVSRPGWDVAEVSLACGSIYERHRQHLHILEVPGVAISSTQIRQRLQAGRSARYLVPDSVLRYIEQEGLYR
jgi:nicotinate-nucleotide adenylyltransferase